MIYRYTRASEVGPVTSRVDTSYLGAKKKYTRRKKWSKTERRIWNEVLYISLQGFKKDKQKPEFLMYILYLFPRLSKCSRT